MSKFADSLSSFRRKHRPRANPSLSSTPYGLVYSLVTNLKVRVQRAINPDKASFGFAIGGAVPIDFTATITSRSKDYRSGSFMIDKLAA